MNGCKRMPLPYLIKGGKAIVSVIVNAIFPYHITGISVQVKSFLIFLQAIRKVSVRFGFQVEFI